ncbi:hypothetical protein [Sporosarcina ureilytica]|uniref:Lipoprotein n=1 Tax=Sporosarcina ureilytica TaxID=298596 RepID=A0A1D8JG79_9BACL|nr:hypothetical protein [Sporosarcina ureilytica]AOV07707.1 hypothetical protein BI350_09290 [Sporosarcina ureilytica]
MKRTTKTLFISFLVCILVACSAKEAPKDNGEVDKKTSSNQQINKEKEVDVNKEDKTDKPNQNKDDEVQLINYFLPNGSKAHYKGEGNEFAEFTIEVHTIGNNYIIVDENNGGVELRKVYRIEENKIVLLAEDPIDVDKSLPDEETLNQLKVKEIYLQKPLVIGTQFDGWSIIETDATVETPLQTFDNALVLEMAGSGFTNFKYLVPGYGEVLRKSIMESDEAEDFIVTSALESIE